MAQYTPSIAVTCDFETIKDSRGYPSPRYVCPQNYVASIRDAGGRALLIPHESVDLTQPHLDFDALVIAGGDFDIPPSYYGEQPRRGLGALLEDRSAAARALCETAIAAQLPMFAVACSCSTCCGAARCSRTSPNAMEPRCTSNPMTSVRRPIM
mgnify:CR=1 FL=1